MKRMIEKQLLEWKNNRRRKPLILRGARQVGKTWSIKKLGSDNFENTIHLDLEKNHNLHSLFKGDLSPGLIVQSIEVLMNAKITSGKTLLFIDEIQSCPRAVMSLRYFYEEMPDLHVIAAGSLLEFSLGEISFPVGRIQYMQMAPMSFSEYLEAGGNNKLVEIIHSKPQKLPEPIHNLLLRELKTYFFIGGMPESVKSFYQTGSLMESFKIHKDLFNSFKDDFRKYAAHSNKDCLEEVFVNTSRNIGNQLAYSGLSDSFSHPTIKKAFELLLKARMINKISSVGKLELPFDVQSSSRKFKAIMLDIGIWQQLSGISIESEIAEPNLMNLYRGALAEQFVGQELTAFTGENLFYWARNEKSSTAEIDYIAAIRGKIYPIEVKSGSSGSLKSLHLALKTYPDCPEGIVFSTREFGEIPEQKITFLPLYYAGQFMNFL